jgi:phage-related protein
VKFVERNIIFHQNHFMDFYLEQQPAVQEKIEFVFSVIRQVERIPKKFLEHIEGSDGLFEIRIEVGSNIFRVFCCFDEGQLVVLFNGFQKKTQKTPRNMIEKATQLKQSYFEFKKQSNGKGRIKKG